MIGVLKTKSIKERPHEKSHPLKQSELKSLSLQPPGVWVQLSKTDTLAQLDDSQGLPYCPEEV